jgi:hypothetical protein
LLLGKPKTKLIVIFSHFYSRIERGCNFLEGHWCSTFTCWHTIYFAIYLAISLFILGH